MADKLTLRPAEAGDALGFSRSKIYEMLAAGEIPSIKVAGQFRIPVKALEKWIAEQRTPRRKAASR